MGDDDLEKLIKGIAKGDGILLVAYDVWHELLKVTPPMEVKHDRGFTIGTLPRPNGVRVKMSTLLPPGSVAWFKTLRVEDILGKGFYDG